VNIQKFIDDYFDKKYGPLKEETKDKLSHLPGPSIWDIIKDVMPWQISDTIWRFKFYLGLLFNPKKLWELPSVISSFLYLEHHERQLGDEHDIKSDEETMCKTSQKMHYIWADEYKEILGPFWKEYECE